MHRLFKTAGLLFLMLLVLISPGYAGNPLWTFTPDTQYPPSVSLTPITSATIKYTITNQSPKPHTLVMQPILGITQITNPGNCPNPFTLGYRQSCTLNLRVDGGSLTQNIQGGPVVCQHGSALQCYQPSPGNTLNISRLPLAQFLITPLPSLHGSITPATPQTVAAGSSLTFLATPDSGYQVDEWLVDGGIAQKGGVSFTLSHIVKNHTVEATFTQSGSIYAAIGNGAVYFSKDNGLTWTPTAVPSPGNAVNSIFSTSTTLYAGSADGNIYYSTNNGVSWNATTAADGSAVNSVFVSGATIYAGTQNGGVYYSANGITWTATTNPGSAAVNSIFITNSHALYVGSNDGNVYYSINNGASWNTITGPETNPVQNIFAVNNQLYVNIRRTSTNSTLPPGTIDFEYAYTSNSLTAANPVWTLYSQITYTLFVNSDASLIYAGTQDGYVFSLTTGDALGFITYSPITSLFFLG
jgi:hypothetical protein